MRGQVTTCPPDFQTFLRPCKVSLKSWLLFAFGITALIYCLEMEGTFPYNVLFDKSIQCKCLPRWGKSINDVRRFSAIFYLPTMSDDFYAPYNVRYVGAYLGAFSDPLSTLKLDVIYGRSHVRKLVWHNETTSVLKSPSNS